MLSRTRLPLTRALSAVLNRSNVPARSIYRNPRLSKGRAFNSSARIQLAVAATQEYKISELSVGDYHSLADDTMDTLLDQLEVLVDSLDNPKYEVEYSSGVLTLNLADKGVYVINKQPPNKQIWLSSPFSGPKRYDYDTQHGVWFYSRDEQTLDNLLTQELSKALDSNVQINLHTTGA